jgi:outer membrane protein assembly factor BamD (BamD/ComL family)
MGEDIMGKNICKNILITFVFVFISVLFFSASEAATLSKESQLFDKGYKYVLAHQPAKAVETFNSFLKEFPKSPSRDAAMYWLGKSLVQLKSYGEAKKVFAEIPKQFPESPFVPHVEKELQALDTPAGVARADADADIKNLVENAVKALNELQIRLAEAEKKATAAEAAMAKALAENEKLQSMLNDEKKKLDAREGEVKNLTDNAAKAILELQTKLSKTEKKAAASEPAKPKP